jgi:hypothetical protein
LKTHSVENQSQKAGAKCAMQSFVTASDELLTHDTLGFFTVKGGSDEGTLAFALPDRCLLPKGSEKLHGELWGVPSMVFHPRAGTTASGGYEASGTLAEWKRMVRPISDEPWYVFAVCAGLTGPFMELAEMDRLIVNVYGPSRTDKTFGLQLAVSPWGRAIEEQAPPCRTSLIKELNADANACATRESAGPAIVLAFDEVTGNRIDRWFESEMDCAHSRCRSSSHPLLGSRSGLVLSCNRRPLLADIEKNGERGVGPSKPVHVMDLAIGHLAFESFLTARRKRKIVETIPSQMRERFGTAGPAFVQAVLNRFKTASAMREYLIYEINEAHDLLLDDLEQQFPQYRARYYEELTPTRIETLRHLAAIYAIGMLGIEMGVLPFYEDHVVRAVCTARNAWLDSLSPVIEGYENIENVRDYLWRFQQPGYYSSR